MTPLESQKEGIVFASDYTLSDRQIGLKGQVAKLIGQQPGENLMRRAVELAGRLLGSRVFSISTLLNSSGRVSSLGLGEPQQVQEQLSI